MQFPRYESYKDSGVEWLGEIPSDWDLIPNKYLFSIRKETVGRRSKSFTLLSLTLNGVIARDMENLQGKFPAEFDTYQIVRNGDLIFCLFDVEETPRTVGHSNQLGMITGAYTVVECAEKINAKYLYYYYLSLDNGKKLKYVYTGLRNVISKDTFLNIKSPVPPIEYQHKVTKFLDQKTAEIDQAIEKKQRLIELLKEQKAILINRAVTKGLNPNVPMKDSGVEWIGEIPVHWTTLRLKYLFKETDTRSKTGEETLLSLRMHIGLIPHNEVSDKIILPANLIGYKRIIPGQLVMNRMRASIGLFGLAKQMGLVSPDYAVFDVLSSIDINYYLTLFKTEIMGSVFRLNSKGMGTGSSGFLRLYTDYFGNIKVPVPPEDEQSEIVEYINLISMEVDRVVSVSEQEIELLNEFRNTLLSNAVTGKIKI